ncbi:hypothetical protein E8D34_08665 [Nocardioides sp. GY 10113]|uniref:PucR family transcriptional regulator n=1 Tax=Nocardioides sp. GY 10113 TaxID=2569761 RepID=UPI0010A7BB1D|nr:helix-turn-helix domain-containing protein [Nocardioides sp. GY 10113]TIC87736.1 hypothetical protein E8D34_08665 [Nocardioides sp. GY 10113]
MNTTEQSVLRWLDGFAEAALRAPEVDAFVRSVDDVILGAVPEIAGDAALVEALHASTRQHWRNFLVGLSGEHRLALPQAAIDLSLAIARRHLDVNVLLKVYRVANKSTFRYFIDRTEPGSLPPDVPRDEALLAVWLRAEQWIDESVERLTDHFTAERTRLSEGAHARRTEAIDALLAGAPPTAQLERLLGHRLGCWQTAFVLSAPRGMEEEVRLFELAERVCQRLGLPAPLTTFAASRELWGWIATPTQPALDVAKVDAVVRDHGLHLALGRPTTGPSGFRLSHLQALSAHRTGLRAPSAVHAYGEIELVCLTGADELAREMVCRTLQPLLGGAKADATLRATLLTYLRCGQHVETTAELLFVHPNTVRYRVARAEELLGGRVAARAAVVEVALAWLEVHGVAAIEGAGRVTVPSTGA